MQIHFSCFLVEIVAIVFLMDREFCKKSISVKPRDVLSRTRGETSSVSKSRKPKTSKTSVMQSLHNKISSEKIKNVLSKRINVAKKDGANQYIPEESLREGSQNDKSISISVRSTLWRDRTLGADRKGFSPSPTRSKHKIQQSIKAAQDSSPRKRIDSTPSVRLAHKTFSPSMKESAERNQNESSPSKRKKGTKTSSDKNVTVETDKQRAARIKESVKRPVAPENFVVETGNLSSEGHFHAHHSRLNAEQLMAELETKRLNKERIEKILCRITTIVGCVSAVVFIIGVYVNYQMHQWYQHDMAIRKEAIAIDEWRTECSGGGDSMVVQRGDSFTRLPCNSLNPTTKEEWTDWSPCVSGRRTRFRIFVGGNVYKIKANTVFQQVQTCGRGKPTESIEDQTASAIDITNTVSELEEISSTSAVDDEPEASELTKGIEMVTSNMMD